MGEPNGVLTETKKFASYWEALSYVTASLYDFVEKDTMSFFAKSSREVHTFLDECVDEYENALWESDGRCFSYAASYLGWICSWEIVQ